MSLTSEVQDAIKIDEGITAMKLIKKEGESPNDVDLEDDNTDDTDSK